MNNQRKINWIQTKCGAGLSLRGTSVPLEGHAGNCVKRVEAESRIPARPATLLNVMVEYQSMGSTKQSALDEVKLAMANTNALFVNEVFGNRNLTALDEIYTSDARILPPGAPMVSGREEIKKFWSDMIHSVKRSACVLTSIDAMPAGDGVVEIGRATLTVEPPGQSAAQIEVKYVVYWRQEDGRWKWHVDIWNQNA